MQLNPTRWSAPKSLDSGHPGQDPQPTCLAFLGNLTMATLAPFYHLGNSFGPESLHYHPVGNNKTPFLEKKAWLVVGGNVSRAREGGARRAAIQ